MNDGPLIHDGSHLMRPMSQRQPSTLTRDEWHADLRRQIQRCRENGLDPLTEMTGPDGPMRERENAAEFIEWLMSADGNSGQR